MPCLALRIRSGWFGCATALVLATAIVLMLGLSVAPNLHERLHPTAASLHECAVTLISSGSCHHSAAAPLIIAPTTAVQFSKVPALNPIWVESPFLGACIFEHAPPAQS
jgi:p-aminobenzoyl-glutamate transporter AbgT